MPDSLALCTAYIVLYKSVIGHVDCVEVLLAAGAHADVSHLDGCHPLDLATEMDHVNINSSPADSSTATVAVVSNSIQVM